MKRAPLPPPRPNYRKQRTPSKHPTARRDSEPIVQYSVPPPASMVVRQRRSSTPQGRRFELPPAALRPGPTGTLRDLLTEREQNLSREQLVQLVCDLKTKLSSQDFDSVLPSDQSDDREFVSAQQDDFLEGLLEEHEQVVSQLLKEKATLEAQNQTLARELEAVSRELKRSAITSTSLKRQTQRPSEREAEGPDAPATDRAPAAVVDTDALQQRIAALELEQRRARELMQRLHRQRDEAFAALERAEQDRDQAIESLRRHLDAAVAAPKPATVEPWHAGPSTLNAVAPGRAKDTLPPSERPTPPSLVVAGALEAALVNAVPDSDTVAAAGLDATSPGWEAEDLPAPPPPVEAILTKRKPEASERPLVEYSLGPGAVAPEQIDAKGGGGRRTPE